MRLFFWSSRCSLLSNKLHKLSCSCSQFLLLYIKQNIRFARRTIRFQFCNVQNISLENIERLYLKQMKDFQTNWIRWRTSSAFRCWLSLFAWHEQKTWMSSVSVWNKIFFLELLWFLFDQINHRQWNKFWTLGVSFQILPHFLDFLDNLQRNFIRVATSHVIILDKKIIFFWEFKMEIYCSDNSLS